MLRIANAAGFWGDWIEAPRRLVEAAEVDFLTLEYLAELTMSILARQRQKDSQQGYAGDFLTVLRSLVPALKSQPQLHIVTNGGGLNPQACARAAAKILAESELDDVAIGIVTGDDLMGSLAELKRAQGLTNLETGEPLDKLAAPVVSANVYFGAQPIAAALDGGARIVITGRVADASLTVGPAVQRFGWKWDDWHRLAAASVAGHLIECGAQVTGGYSTQWQSMPNLADVGYPIAELESDGSCVITKPSGTGGVVNRRTVVEQLIYEIGDPQHYLTPDVDVDFTTVHVEALGNDRVAVRGATGRPAPPTLKATIVYEDGYAASGQLLVYGPDCIAKARACAEIIWQRMKLAGFTPRQTHVELLGVGDGVPLKLQESHERSPREVILRLTVRDPRKETIENFALQFAPLITSGPAGLAGYATGRPQPQRTFGHWPTLIPRDLFQPVVAVRRAEEWNRDSLIESP